MSECKADLQQENKKIPQRWNDHRPTTCHCGNCFSVYHGEFGVLFSAGVELMVCAQLMKVYAENYGYDLCDALIAGATKSSLCLTTKQKSRTWREKLGIETTKNKENK